MSSPGKKAAGETGQNLDLLMQDLVDDLRPVKALPPPWVRALAFVAVVLAIALGLAMFADLGALRTRIFGAPDMALALLGSAVTSGLAAIAAMQLSLPDRSKAWALLPVPALALWIGASGLGCARAWLLPGTHDASLAESMECLRFIIGLSIPLSAGMLWMLRRGYSLMPGLTGALAGLAVAAAAATLLNFFHPFDAALSDLAVHAVAVAFVVLANRLLAGRVMMR